MGKQSIISIEAVIDYIESHLDGKLELETVAEAVHYSKYHLHRLFTETVGMTIHDYVQRRHFLRQGDRKTSDYLWAVHVLLRSGRLSGRASRPPGIRGYLLVSYGSRSRGVRGHDGGRSRYEYMGRLPEPGKDFSGRAFGVWFLCDRYGLFKEFYSLSWIDGVLRSCIDNGADRDYHDAAGENRYLYARACLWLTGNHVCRFSAAWHGCIWSVGGYTSPAVDHDRIGDRAYSHCSYNLFSSGT